MLKHVKIKLTHHVTGRSTSRGREAVGVCRGLERFLERRHGWDPGVCEVPMRRVGFEGVGGEGLACERAEGEMSHVWSG